MPITDQMQQVILQQGNATDIAKCAKADGVRNLRESGLVKVRLGVTTLEEVISCTNE
jgi:type IV pilus assembly protein PilB